MQYRVLAEKLKEAAASVLPVTAIVAVLCLALVRVDVGLMLSFLLGSGLLILGMGLFTLGAELSMSRIGNLIGAKMTKSRKLWFILAVSFLLGVAILLGLEFSKKFMQQNEKPSPAAQKGESLS